MTSSRLLFPEFRDEQSDSKYPFVDNATLVSSAANFAIEKTAFIDATFYPIGGGGSVFLSQIAVAETVITLTFTTTSPAVTATAIYDWREPLAGGVLPVIDAYGRPAGMVLVDTDKLRELSGWPVADYTFAQAATTFVATAFIPAKEPGVRAIKSAAEDFLTNDVWLIGDGGVALRFEEPNIIRVDIVGIPLFRRFACGDAETVFPPRRFVKTINGCPPDEYGNFTFTATDAGLAAGASGNVLRVYPTLSGLVIDAVGSGGTS